MSLVFVNNSSYNLINLLFRKMRLIKTKNFLCFVDYSLNGIL
nr:MAG TPA: hypothetical protein [Caudoviricetes sp.]